MDNRVPSAGNVVPAGLLLVACLVLPFGAVLGASDLDEFKVKREAVFEFAQKPVVMREGDRVTITFETKGFCDVTVAIEDAGRKIVRHLASGVLGPNAPAPFEKDSKRQTLVWDGKDDQGVYVDDKDALTVRVSLGLNPRFERSLFWSPCKRVGGENALIRAAPDGVYVFDAAGVDSLRFYDHDGTYRRTVYPFPRDDLAKVKGLPWAVFPQDGQELPRKQGFLWSTFLTSGSSAYSDKSARGGAGASAVAIHDGRIALVMDRLNRLASTGGTGGLELVGPTVSFPGRMGGYYYSGPKVRPVHPRSAAFSPDGRYLYLAGYQWGSATGLGLSAIKWLNGVVRLDYVGDEKPKVFAGSMTEGEDGTDNRGFRCPASVACDAKGRVYIADYANNRIQVYAPDGALLKTIPVPHPAKIEIRPATGEIFVLSGVLSSGYVKDGDHLPATLTRLGGFDDPRPGPAIALPIEGYGGRASIWGKTVGLTFDAAIDFWAEPVTVWISHGGRPLQIYTVDGDRLILRRDFGKEVERTIVRAAPPVLQRQRLYVHPVTGTLYVGEGDSGVNKSFMELVAIDPETGRARLVDLPMTAEDLCIDLDGLFYLRTDTMVGRFDPNTWKEVPFDYGLERKGVGFDSKRTVHLKGGLWLPASGRPWHWHLGGMGINAQRHLVVTCYNTNEKPDRQVAGSKIAFDKTAGGGDKYTPTLYPGRVRHGEIHVWDDRGRILHKDAVPGITLTDGIGIDRDDDLYLLANPNRIVDGQPYFIRTGETLMKVRPGAAKVLSPSKHAEIQLPVELGPERSPDVEGYRLGQAWVEGAEWFYGGVGFGVKGSCICWNARFALDLIARSFAPEVERSSVAVLDSSGNLILRLGRYGNVDDGVPLIKEGGPLNPRSIGGDEVALFHAAYVGTHTDRRLFIADAGNSRLLSVRLDYHANERLTLKGVPDRGSR